MSTEVRNRIAGELRSASDSGTFIRNAQCQESWSTSTPASVGPAIGPRIIGTPTMLITRPIRSGPATLASIIIPTGIVAPPATPCSTRNAISISIEVAAAHSADALANTSSEPKYSRRAPNRRASQPVVEIDAASPSR